MMNRFFRISALAALALSVLTLTAQAQRVKQFGVVAGVDFSTLSGCTSGDNCFLSEGSSSKTGFIGGLFLGLPLGSGNLWLEPEVLYVSGGDKYDNSLYTGTETLNYITIPVLLRWNSKPDGGIFVLAGPSVNFNITCNDKGTVNPSGPDYDEDCDTFDVTANTVIGGTLGLGFSKGRFGIEGRYMMDFGDAVKYTDPDTDEETSLDIKNNIWSIMLRFTK